MIKIFNYILLLVCFTNFQAQDFIFKSYVDQNNISTDDYIRFTVESSERVRLDNLQFQTEKSATICDQSPNHCRTSLKNLRDTY